MSDSARPHRRQPTRLPHSWDSPGKNTGAGCHFLFQCMKVKSESEVATPSNPIDCSLPGSSVHGIIQARVLEWGAMAFSSGALLNLSHLFGALQDDGSGKKATISRSYIGKITKWGIKTQHISFWIDLVCSILCSLHMFVSALLSFL